MKPLLKLFAVTLLTGAAVAGSASAQYLPSGVRPMPTSPPSHLPQPGILPGGCYPPPRPLPPVVIDIDYKVFYRAGAWDRWHYYTTAQTRHEARHIERRLETLGYQVELVEKIDRTPDR